MKKKKMAKEKKNHHLIDMSLINMKRIICFLLLLMVVGCQSTKKDSEIARLNEQINNLTLLNEYYNKAIENYYLALSYGMNADYNYESFSFNWDNEFLDDAITTCEAARDGYAESNQKYNFAIANFEEANKYGNKEIIQYYINASNLAIKIQWNHYEACEYFESSARSYLKGNKIIGDIELKKANGKIKLRDSIIEPYNYYVSKIEVILD